MDFEHLLEMWEICSLKLRLLSRITPRNFVLFTLVMVLLPVLIGLISILFLYEKQIKWDFSQFNLSLFAFSQLLTELISASRRKAISSGVVFLNLQLNVLSSANNENLKKFEQRGKSFIKIKKRSGPRMDP